MMVGNWRVGDVYDDIAVLIALAPLPDQAPSTRPPATPWPNLHYPTTGQPLTRPPAPDQAAVPEQRPHGRR